MYMVITLTPLMVAKIESEANFIGSYAFQQPYLKGLALQYLLIDYPVKYGTDFTENRFCKLQ